jgi:glycosyltransferase involved in cell wall biosynthesis
MNILVINYEYPPVGGGGGVICRDISEEIASGGHRVDVITSQYADLKGYEEVNGVGVFRVPVLFRNNQNAASILSMLSYVPSAIKRVGKLLRREKYDVLNTHFAIPSGPAGNYISKKYGIPNVLTIHGGDIFDPSKSYSPHRTVGLKQTVRKMLASADRVVAQSSDTKGNAMNIYNISRDVDIVPLGIRPNPYSAKMRKDIGIPEDIFVFTTIGRLVRRKNLEDLFSIMKKIVKSQPAMLLVMGDGPEKTNMEKKISELGLNENIRLLGRVSDEEKYQYLMVSDAYLSTAIHEGFGIVFLEAMECGLPVFCYERGGQVDFLKSGKTGFLIKLGDTETFGMRLLELMSDDALKEEMRTNNRDLVKNFYISNCANRYLSIFEEVISR